MELIPLIHHLGPSLPWGAIEFGTKKASVVRVVYLCMQVMKGVTTPLSKTSLSLFGNQN